jgi:hypothetical protein
MNEPDTLKLYERQYGPFTHMASGDKAIWLRYLMQGGAQYAPFTYDLRVGNGLRMPQTASGYAIRSARALTTKRIDVVCFIGYRPWVIEVKQRAGLSAIGQMIGYRNLYAADHPFQEVPGMMLVTDELQPDMEQLLIEQEIMFTEVGL